MSKNQKKTMSFPMNAKEDLIELQKQAEEENKYISPFQNLITFYNTASKPEVWFSINILLDLKNPIQDLIDEFKENNEIVKGEYSIIPNGIKKELLEICSEIINSGRKEKEEKRQLIIVELQEKLDSVHITKRVQLMKTVELLLHEYFNGRIYDLWNNLNNLFTDSDSTEMKRSLEKNTNKTLIEETIKKTLNSFDNNPRKQKIIENKNKKHSHNFDAKTSSISDIFHDEDYQKYLNPLTQINKPLLSLKGTTYNFIGNQKNERGIVGQWVWLLKSKGLIKELNREKIAEILSQNINNYSVGGVVLQDESKGFIKIKQDLLNLLDSVI